MGWQRQILRVNLNAGTCKAEPLNMDWTRQYLGQRGLATKYFVEEVDPKVDPLSPANKLIMATGPLTGTMASTGGRYSVITKGPLTGAIACSNSGGFFGAELKSAGWDMIIFEGRSPTPVYLHLEDDKAELRPADAIWGKSVWEADAWLHRQHQDPLLRVAAIGVAAEKGVLFSGVVNDLHRAAGRSGVGTVMGSKNLKAVAVRGTRGVGKFKDPAAFIKATEAGKQVLRDNPVTGQGLPKYGTQVLMNVINEMGAMPTRNWRTVQFEGASKISGEAMYEPRPGDGKTNLVRNGACFGCTIACGRIPPSIPPISRFRGNRSITVKPPVGWNTRPPGRWAAIPAWTISMRSPMPISSATNRASTRSPSAPPSPRRWSCMKWACSPKSIPAASTLSSAMPRLCVSSRTSPGGVRVSALNWVSAPSGCAPNTAIPNCP